MNKRIMLDLFDSSIIDPHFLLEEKDDVVELKESQLLRHFTGQEFSISLFWIWD